MMLKEAEEKHKLERELVRSVHQICRVLYDKHSNNTFASLIP